PGVSSSDALLSSLSLVWNATAFGQTTSCYSNHKLCTQYAKSPIAPSESAGAPILVIALRSNSQATNTPTLTIDGIPHTYRTLQCATIRSHTLYRRATQTSIDPSDRTFGTTRVTDQEAAVATTKGFQAQRWFFFSLFALSGLYALYQLGVLFYQFGFQVNLRAVVYLTSLAFVITTMAAPFGPVPTSAGLFFTYLTFLLALWAYLGLLMTWNYFVVSFYQSPFGRCLTPGCYIVGGFAACLALLAIIGAFPHSGAEELDEFTAMIFVFVTPLVLWIKSISLGIYAVRCFRAIPRDIQPQSVFRAIIKMTAVIIVLQGGFAFASLAVVLYAVRVFTHNPHVYMTFLVCYHLTTLFTFVVIFWFLTVHDSIPSLLTLVSKRASAHNPNLYIQSTEGAASVIPRESPLLSSLPIRHSLLNTSTSHHQRLTRDPVESEKRPLTRDRRSVQLETALRKASKHSLFQIFETPQLEAVPEGEPKYRIGRFQWERESERFQQLYSMVRRMGKKSSLSLQSSYYSWSLPSSRLYKKSSTLNLSSQVSLSHLLGDTVDFALDTQSASLIQQYPFNVPSASSSQKNVHNLSIAIPPPSLTLQPSVARK
ncbi:hypothetical protein H4R35_006418, partial [Dimargaris xerosporica]